MKNMSAIKEFYHEEICRGNEEELMKAMELDAMYHLKEEDDQIIARAEEMKHSEMPNFLR